MQSVNDASSSISSRNSTPDSQRRDSRSGSRHDSIGSAKSGSSINTNTPQTNFLLKQKEMREQQRESQVSISLNLLSIV